MTTKPKSAPRRKYHATSAEVSDPRRPFTETTWVLVAIMLTEEQAEPWEIAKLLCRDTRDVAQKIAEARDSGHLAKVEVGLLQYDGLHASILRRMLREAVAM